ncbi:MAG TPA: nitrilase family protein [Puia sp.]|jgi:predicted amidohydrolase|nr:nitrilase family protein [Puia sp.]
MSTLTVTTIQADLQWEDKAANFRRLEEKIDGIIGDTELIILPEMFSTGFSMRPEAFAEQMDGPAVSWMRSIAARRKVILTGSLIIEEDGNYFNRLVWMLPNGQYGCYDKRHRFAYAGEDDHYAAGQRRLVASVKGWKILLLICYDLRFPVWSRQTPPEHVPASASISNYGEFAPIKPTAKTDTPPTPLVTGPTPTPAPPSPPNTPAKPSTRASDNPASPAAAPPLEYDLILYVANWPERRSHAWKTLLQARAIENQSYVIGVNRVGADGNGITHSGDSMIIDPLGETLYHAGPTEDVFTLTLTKDHLSTIRQRFPFWRDADHFYIEP